MSILANRLSPGGNENNSNEQKSNAVPNEDEQLFHTESSARRKR